MSQILKLGRLPKRNDTRTLKLTRYFKAKAVPSFPSTCRYGKSIKDWLMLGNDSAGNCTLASALHMIMLWRKEHEIDFLPSASDALSLYSQFAGYDPAKPDETDQGAVELDILKAWRNTGIAGKQIAAFVDIDISNLDHMKAAIWLFGAIYVGVTLTQTAMDEASVDKDWSVTRPWKCKSKIVGGHAVPLIGYEQDRLISVTWGKEKGMTVPWWQEYGDEAWAVISTDWADKNLHAPNGFDLEALLEDLKTIDGPIDNEY
jgi:hypothetical protein